MARNKTYILQFRRLSLREARKKAKEWRARGYSCKLISTDGGKWTQLWTKLK